MASPLLAPAANTTTPTGRDPAAAIRNTPTPPPTSPRSSNPRGLIGAKLGRYEVLDELGHGGMATVYRAHDPRLGRDVALKVLHPQLRDNPEIAERFRHEARAVAKLTHPSIVEIYDVPDEEDGERFLVAELVDGPSLRKWMQLTSKELEGTGVVAPRAPLMPPEIAAALMLQVLGALARAHQEGIVHRDVKPENILLAGLGAASSQRPSDPNRAPPTAKLTDFGIAKILDTQSMTSTGQILGSPAHMAPEQIEGGDVSARVDVFASGVLFYELLTGTLPFDGKNPAQVIRRVLDGTFTPADRVAPTVGGRWAGILAMMLARDPLKRPGDVDEVCGLLRRELQALGVTDPDRELVHYLRDPGTVLRAWGERVKPKLLERAVAAREAGDSIGAANDLNRALAYDPGDPRLMRVVTSMRSRERQLAAAKRAAPVVVLGLLVVLGTFFGVRQIQQDPATHDPSTMPSALVPPPTTSKTTTTATASASVTATASVATTASQAHTAPIVHDAAPTTHVTRRARFNVFPAGSFTIDGEGPFEPLAAGERELTVGEHLIPATGVKGCCAPYSSRVKIVEGDGVQLIDIRLTLNPAHVFLGKAPEGATVSIVVRTKTGEVLAQGPAPLSVPIKDTSVPVTITLEASGYPSRSIEATLAPGDARYEDFQ
ncbi:MAG: hypothetical protein NVSMB47_15470 [Polyangiales bacterium]